jgi:hypothetical protein
MPPLSTSAISRPRTLLHRAIPDRSPMVTVAGPPEPGSFTPAVPSACPTVGRAGAANDRQPLVTSGQQR